MHLKQICNVVIQRNIGLQSVYARWLFTKKSESKDESFDITSADEKPIYAESDSEEFQAEIARKRNKSRLSSSDRNKLMGLRPYDKTYEWYHNTVRYKRRILGRYGLKAIDEPAGFVWPTLEDVKDMQEYENVAFPLSLQERWKKLEEARERKAKYRIEREEQILANLSKMDQWIVEMKARIEKKKTEMEAARIRKEHLVEEVRRHFGFNISPHDSRFKELLEEKEKQEKKKKKEAKKKAKLARMTLMVHTQIKELSPEETADKESNEDSKKKEEHPTE
ncbi:growth arrest and DNA damage-inducible proteins-interacting protein 1 [Harpegnathos saltator]|uniref:Large ribosomal subunit protein mL64 n=1 Tax=Harpegnathos saltator TaxID=610380 RepID=E2C408_HARSA|nr:growth arrest and DNA damage-inducible proteins-interacting protein 1 [Harpegnathos saltator]EFN77394.1 hypothetical protein EAI_14525 [Harpegnathos saltator]